MNLKRVFFYLIISLSFINTVKADKYNLKDLTIDIENYNGQNWYVFTRDNIKDIDSITELDFSSEDLSSVMYDNDIYLVAYDYSEYYNSYEELYISIKPVQNVKNLNTYENNEIKDFASALKEKMNAADYNIKTINDYKFVLISKYEKNMQKRNTFYYTVMNGYGYTISLQVFDRENQKDTSLADQIILEAIVKTSIFKTQEENNNKELKAEKNSNKNDYFGKFIIGTLSTLIIVGIMYLFKLKKSNYSNNNSINLNQTSINDKKNNHKMNSTKSSKQGEEKINLDEKYDHLIKLKELLDNNILTQEEFEKEKKRILNRE